MSKLSPSWIAQHSLQCGHTCLTAGWTNGFLSKGDFEATNLRRLNATPPVLQLKLWHCGGGPHCAPKSLNSCFGQGIGAASWKSVAVVLLTTCSQQQKVGQQAGCHCSCCFVVVVQQVDDKSSDSKSQQWQTRA